MYVDLSKYLHWNFINKPQVGGQTGDIFGIRAPFQIAFGLMIFSLVYSIIFLPHIPVASVSESLGKVGGIGSILAPLKVFSPQLLRLGNGKTAKHYGVLLLGLGVFFAVLATGFIPILFQMYAINAFQFGSAENGYLMCFTSIIRGMFLSFAFPKIISWGRKRYPSLSSSNTTKPLCSRIIPVTPEAFEAIPALQGEQEPASIPRTNPERDNVTFDLLFLKWSLVVDGLLTGATAFSTKGWHIYLAALLLPLASGSSSAAKGVIMAMTPKWQNASALTAITLVEMIGTLSTSKI